MSQNLSILKPGHEKAAQKKICKRCKTEYSDDNGYPVCDYCLQYLDNWE